MYKEKKEEIEFVSNKERNEFIKKINKALDDEEPLSEEEFNKIKKLFD